MDLLKRFGNWVGEKIQAVGDTLGWEGVSKFGRNLQNMCSEKIAEERSYDKSTSDIHSTSRLNEILVSFSDGYLRQSEQIEKAAIREVERYYDDLISLVEQSSNERKNVSNIKGLKSSKSRISKTITGSVRDSLSKRMSLDDSECLRILKMDSGSSKRHEMDAFIQKIIKEALANLSKTVRNELNDSVSDLGIYFEDLMEEQEKTMGLLSKQLDRIIHRETIEKKDIEMSCVAPLYASEVVDQVCNIIVD